jgi:hypothetical protein
MLSELLWIIWYMQYMLIYELCFYVLNVFPFIDFCSTIAGKYVLHTVNFSTQTIVTNYITVFPSWRYVLSNLVVYLMIESVFYQLHKLWFVACQHD